MIAYSTDNPDTIAAWHAAFAARDAFTVRLNAGREAIGRNTGAMTTPNRMSGGFYIVGLAADDPDNPPPGWRYSSSKQHLVPRRGNAGAVARRWLEEHQPPEDSNGRQVMAQHGLPIHDLVDGHDLGRISMPAIFLHDGVLWAHYDGKPGQWLAGNQQPQCTWTERKLSEYYAAREAYDAAQAAEATEAGVPVGAAR